MVAILKFANFPYGCTFQEVISRSMFIIVEFVIVSVELCIRATSGKLTSNSELPVAFYENPFNPS